MAAPSTLRVECEPGTTAAALRVTMQAAGSADYLPPSSSPSGVAGDGVGPRRYAADDAGGADVAAAPTDNPPNVGRLNAAERATECGETQHSQHPRRPSR